jgi:error-prone DNA polymerase
MARAAEALAAWTIRLFSAAWWIPRWIFMTLEDETGFVNLVLWPDVFQRNAVLARTESFLGVSGKLQREQQVVHLVVEELWQPRLERAPAEPRSRDFH